MFTQAWQNAVNVELNEGMEADRLRALLGPDFERVEATREWLGAHPRRLEILARLSRK